MLKTFTIVANEVIGLSATECTLMQFSIDMALAENSALNDCVPSNRLRAYPQQWLPGESNS